RKAEATPARMPIGELGQDRVVEKGIADVARRDPAAREPLLLEGIDAKQRVEIAEHPDARLAPGPGHGRDHVEDRDAEVTELAGEAQIEIGRVEENGRVRPVALRPADEVAEDAED